MKKILFIIVFLILIGAGIYLGTAIDADSIVERIRSLGAWGPVALILFLIIEVFAAPVPGGWLGIASGYIFGPWLGWLYSYIGMTVGSVLVFEATRRWGRPFAKKMISAEQYEKYSAVGEKSVYVLILLYAIPLFPVDVVSVLLGLTSLKRQHFWTAVFIGFAPNMFVLNFFGDVLTELETPLLIAGIVLIGLVVYGIKAQKKKSASLDKTV